MHIPFLDLKRQYQSIKKEIKPVVLEQMESCSYINGAEVSKLENELAVYLDVKHAITCANGTDALAIALLACGVGPGDEVITTPFTFFATAEAIASIGAVPVFADINEDNFNINPNKINKRITPKTKVILPVHIFGYPADMDPIMDIAKKNNLAVIEDACQAVGAEYKGKKAGSIGDLGCISFYPTKNLGAFGDGGMIATNSDKLNIICRAFKEHGAGKNGAEAKSLLSNEAKEEIKTQVTNDPNYNPYKYFNYLIGYNSRLDTIQAAVLRVKLKYLNDYNIARARIANIYNDNLNGSGVVTPAKCGYGSEVYHQYAVRTPFKEKLMNYLSSNGIGNGSFYPVPLHLQKAFHYLGYKDGDLPVAEKVAKETVCLPIFPELTNEEINYVCEKIRDFSKNFMVNYD